VSIWLMRSCRRQDPTWADRRAGAAAGDRSGTDTDERFECERSLRRAYGRIGLSSEMLNSWTIIVP